MSLANEPPTEALARAFSILEDAIRLDARIRDMGGISLRRRMDTLQMTIDQCRERVSLHPLISYLGVVEVGNREGDEGIRRTMIANALVPFEAGCRITYAKATEAENNGL